MGSIAGDDGLSGIPVPLKFGVKGESTENIGVLGLSGNIGVSGVGKYAGVLGRGVEQAWFGVHGNSVNRIGVDGLSQKGIGVLGISHEMVAVVANGTGPSARGVYAEASGAGPVIEADHRGQGGTAIYAHGSSVAGHFKNDTFGIKSEAFLAMSDPAKHHLFYGNVVVSGATLKSSATSSLIDHPADPANRYLEHASVESDERKNIYDGIAVLGEKGEAEVELPGWFAALNRDFRYQLTCLGKPAPVYIAQEIEGHRFRIAGGHPRLRVSWQVTGIRQDPWAQAHPFAVERDKPEEERGFYIEPALYGEPPERTVWGAQMPRPEPVPAELLELLKGRRGGENSETEPQP